MGYLALTEILSTGEICFWIFVALYKLPLLRNNKNTHLIKNISSMFSTISNNHLQSSSLSQLTLIVSFLFLSYSHHSNLWKNQIHTWKTISSPANAIRWKLYPKLSTFSSWSSTILVSDLAKTLRSEIVSFEVTRPDTRNLTGFKLILILSKFLRLRVSGLISNSSHPFVWNFTSLSKLLTQMTLLPKYIKHT